MRFFNTMLKNPNPGVIVRVWRGCPDTKVPSSLLPVDVYVIFENILLQFPPLQNWANTPELPPKGIAQIHPFMFSKTE